MSYDEGLADRVRVLLLGPGLTEKRMFGGLAFLVDGHMAVAVSGQGGLMVRVEPAEVEQLLREPGTEPMVMRGRPMTGWLRVTGEQGLDDDALPAWVERSRAYAAALPPKD